MKSVRVRFAPSPTGHLHIGGLRTALFNWIFARQHKGTFLVRIEDTDLERSKPEFEDSILQALAWADVTSDEPIVRQTERMDLYKKIIADLLAQGKAYKCYCPTNPMASEETYYKYDGRCRTGAMQNGNKGPFVVRIKLPLEQATIAFNDLIRGPISFPTEQFDDFIIARSDGTPIYNFVVVLDDAAMNISHVIRGEDHISNTPKQIVLYQACGYEIPHFAHLPLILGPTGARLSKRDAATAVLDYKRNGYLAPALCNYLVRLGWSYGDQEIFTREELIKLFRIEDVGKKGAIFDQNKLDWVNSHYLRLHDAQTLLNITIADVEPNVLKQLQPWSQAKILDAINLYKERVKTLRELAHELVNLHASAHTPSNDDLVQWIQPSTRELLTALVEKLHNIQAYTPDLLSASAQEIATAAGVKLVKVAQPVRLALIGKTQGPGIFELMGFLGREESVQRLHAFIQSYTHK